MFKEILTELSPLCYSVSEVVWYPLGSLLVPWLSLKLGGLPFSFQQFSWLWLDLWQWSHQRLSFLLLQVSPQELSSLQAIRSELSAVVLPGTVGVFTPPTITRLHVCNFWYFNPCSHDCYINFIADSDNTVITFAGILQNQTQPFETLKTLTPYLVNLDWRKDLILETYELKTEFSLLRIFIIHYWFCSWKFLSFYVLLLDTSTCIFKWICK